MVDGRRFDCRVCGYGGRRYNFYMMRDEVWMLANGGRRAGIMCLRCARSALGRPLSMDDFKPGLPINEMGVWQALLDEVNAAAASA